MTTSDGVPSPQESGTPTSAPGPGPDQAAELLVDELDRAEATLVAVEAALARLDEGAYGRCTSCGTPIEAAVLDEDPAAPHCQACAHDQGPGPGGDSAPPAV